MSADFAFDGDVTLAAGGSVSGTTTLQQGATIGNALSMAYAVAPGGQLQIGKAGVGALALATPASVAAGAAIAFDAVVGVLVNVSSGAGNTTLTPTLPGLYEIDFHATANAASAWQAEVAGARVPGSNAASGAAGFVAARSVVFIGAGSALRILNTGAASVQVLSAGVALRYLGAWKSPSSVTLKTSPVPRTPATAVLADTPVVFEGATAFTGDLDVALTASIDSLQVTGDVLYPPPTESVPIGTGGGGCGALVGLTHNVAAGASIQRFNALGTNAYTQNTGNGIRVSAGSVYAVAFTVIGNTDTTWAIAVDGVVVAAQQVASSGGTAAFSTVLSLATDQVVTVRNTGAATVQVSFTHLGVSTAFLDDSAPVAV